MTENEAIKEIRFNMSTIGLKKEAAERVIEARNMAVKALEENQQYKAIGLTPFQIYEKIGGLDIELSKYLSIGTIEELKILKEKNTPKKVIKLDNHDYYDYKCPTCGMPDKDCMGKKYCNCGQALDLSKED